MFKRCVLAVLVLCLSRVVFAQADPTDEFIRREMQRQGIPGLSLVVLRDSAVVKAAGYGFADVAQKTPATPETVYKIASVSKQFIASGIMVLVQEGRLSVDDPVSRYLRGTPASWTPITIRHLLTHTSGIIREAPAFNPSRIQSDADVVKSAYPVPLRFPPGERWEYGNVNYFALAEIIRTVSGRPWTEFLDEKVFKPSGMHATYPTNTKLPVANRAVGYVDNDNPRPAADWAALRPSGAFLSTVLDLAKWDAMLATDRILTAATRRQMWTPVMLRDGSTSPYGFGWYVNSTGGRTRVHHSGGMPGTRSAFVRHLEQRVTIILLMNLDDVDIDAIVGGLARLHVSDPKAEKRGGA